MHEKERAHLILKLTQERLVVPVRELIARTGASSATIRRDLTELAEAGLVRRVHGGVQASGVGAAVQNSHPSGLRTDRLRHMAIAWAAADLCEEGEAIILGAGEATYQMVEPLLSRRLHILTPSFLIASALLAANTQSRVILPGGELYSEQGIVLSPFEEDAIQYYSASKLFLCSEGLSPLGVTESDPILVRANLKLLKRAQDVILLLPGASFTKQGSISLCPLDRLQMVITDPNLPPMALEWLRTAGVEVRVVGANDQLSRFRLHKFRRETQASDLVLDPPG